MRKKFRLEQIHKKIASIGHDTKLETAPDEAYNNLYMCCKYRDEEVVKNHQKKKSCLIKQLFFFDIYFTSFLAFHLHPLAALEQVIPL